MAVGGRAVNRAVAIGLLFVATALAASGCGRKSESPAARRPNVLFVLLDDIRWDTVGYAGHPNIRTPNIDRIANEGVNFKNAFCTTSLCSPSRASILSGLYAHGTASSTTSRNTLRASRAFQRCSRKPDTPRHTSANTTWAKTMTSPDRGSITSSRTRGRASTSTPSSTSTARSANSSRGITRTW